MDYAVSTLVLGSFFLSGLLVNDEGTEVMPGFLQDLTR